MKKKKHMTIWIVAKKCLLTVNTLRDENFQQIRNKKKFLLSSWG